MCTSVGFLHREIFDVRRVFCDEDNPELQRLSFLERHLPHFFSIERADERKWLITQLARRRYETFVLKAMQLCTTRAFDGVKNLSGCVKANRPDYELKWIFDSLSPETRALFYWAVWIYVKAPMIHQEGEKRLKANWSLLREIRAPILHVRGETLCEQALHRLEMRHSLENVRKFGNPAELRRLEMAQELEEFERVALLYPSLDPHQRTMVLGNVSPRVRNWVLAFEKSAQKRERLLSDSRHLYLWRGAHITLNGTRFQVFAPYARQMKLLLTAYGHEEHCLDMHKDTHGVWDVQTHLAPPGRTYRYCIEDMHGNWSVRTDPFSFAVMQTKADTLESVVTDIDAYDWSDQEWMERRRHSDPLKNALSIYELNIDSWRKHFGAPLSFRELASQLVGYLEYMRFTHVEIYGLLDNKNAFSWGYQTDHFFAPNRRQHNVNDLKYLIDACHQRNIGVLIDWIPGHYKHEHGGDRSQSLYEYDGSDLFGKEPTPWGTVYFDFSKEEARRLMLSSALYWFEQMHIDGMRLDAISPMVNRQEHAVNFLKELNAVVHEQYPGILMIAEETDGFPRVTQSVHEGGLGFDAKLGVYLQWKMRNYFRTPYEQRSSDEHHRDKLLRHLSDVATSHDRWMIAHTHDDAASGTPHRHSTVYGSIPTWDSWRRFADIRLFLAWNLFVPGFGHMIHMGDEIGQKWPWNERLGAGEGSVEWSILDPANYDSHYHRGIQECVRDMNGLYRSRGAFWNGGYRMISHRPQDNVLGFHRDMLAVIFNFSPMGYYQYDFPLDPESSGITEAREIFSTDGFQYGGTGQFRNTYAYIVRSNQGTATHLRVAMPPLSVLIFEERF